MTQYRYQLGKLTGRCPRCGRRTFKFYVDTLSGEIIAPTVGRCNREINCRYHLTPREHGLAGMSLDRTLGLTAKPMVQLVRRADFLTDDDLRPGIRSIESDNLYRYLLGFYADFHVRELCKRMYVGHSRYDGNATVFGLVDRHGRIRSAKVMAYDAATGRRIKRNGAARVCYAHTLLQRKDFCYEACFFGEHLAAQAPPDCQIVVVESEKSALVLSLELEWKGLDNRYVVVATGGASALRPEAARMSDPLYRGYMLRGRRLLLVPDADMVDTWNEYARLLRQWAAEVEIVDVRRQPFSLTGSDDIADFIFRRKTNQFLANNPNYNNIA